MTTGTGSVDQMTSRGQISLEEFRRLDLRIGEITVVEPISGSDRLLAVTVDLGAERRTLVAGVGKAYSTEQLKG